MTGTTEADKREVARNAAQAGFLIIDSDDVALPGSCSSSSHDLTDSSAAHTAEQEQQQAASSTTSVAEEHTQVVSPALDKRAAALARQQFMANLNREWEIVTVEELRRRLSLSDLTDTQTMPIPQGASESKILDEYMIRKMLEVLPARAEGYPWRLVYSSMEHGFSLRTLYRKMADVEEETTPSVVLVRTTDKRIFGACVSAPIRVHEDHFYGTGDSCFLLAFTAEKGGSAETGAPGRRDLCVYHWTGANQMFVLAAPNFLAFGAGGGHYGLWLDADLNLGTTMRCETYDNAPLVSPEGGGARLASGQRHDFIIEAIECWAFALDY